MTTTLVARTLNQLLSERPSELLASLPIGLFDSGVGGLTVLSALKKRLPHEKFIYLGDTARLPYGTKGEDTVVRYALQAAEQLVKRDIKLLVIACNTATAAALPALQKAYAPLPVIGVVEPGAEAACTASKSGNILIMATESTIRSKAYSLAIEKIRPDAKITGLACSLFVPLAEEGWVDGPIVEGAARRYLDTTLGHIGISDAGVGDDAPDCIVLGCTHFPLLSIAIKNVVTTLAGPKVAFVDSAATTAKVVEDTLAKQGLLAIDADKNEDAFCSTHFLCTDAPERFARVGSIFLGEPIDPEALELVVL